MGSSTRCLQIRLKPYHPPPYHIVSALTHPVLTYPNVYKRRGGLTIVLNFYSQATKPAAAKLYESARNASYQANATRDAAQSALKAAQLRLEQLKGKLSDAKAKRQKVLGAVVAVPLQLGGAQFRVSYC